MHVWLGLWELVLIIVPAVLAVWYWLRPWRPVLLRARLGKALAWVTLLGLFTGPFWWLLTLYHDTNAPGNHLWTNPWWFTWFWGILIPQPWVAVVWLVAVFLLVINKGLWLARILIVLLLVVMLCGVDWSDPVNNLQQEPAASQAAQSKDPVCVQMRQPVYDAQTELNRVNGDELLSRNALNRLKAARKGVISAWRECLPVMRTTIKLLPQEGCSRTVTFVVHTTYAGTDLRGDEDNGGEYEWLFGDPNRANSSHTDQANITKTYTVPGTYTVTMWPTDVWKVDGEDEYPPVTLRVKIPRPHC